MQIAGRLVICAVGGDRGFLELPPSTLNPQREFISGGERSLYELAVAASALGLDVELRGSLNPPILFELCAAAGVAPRTGLKARRPTPDDLVVLPEAAEVDLIATTQLSGCRRVFVLLAPPGLWGWSFLPGWAGPADGSEVGLNSVGRPESFRAMADLGFSVWTNARGIAESGRRAGVPVEWLGTGTPVEFPEMPEKQYDLAVIESNRWYRDARAIADELPDASLLRVGPVPSTYSLSAALAPARLLVWPSRIEGMSRIARESRAVGTVPVALATNPFVTDTDHGSGVVLAPDSAGIVDELRRLLQDADRVQRMAAEAVVSAREQVAWEPYVRRVEQALETVPDRPSDFSLGYFGALIERHDRERTTSLINEQRKLEEARSRVDQLVELGTATESALKITRNELRRSEEDLASVRLQLVTLQDQLADRWTELEARQAELMATRQELEEYRQRLAVRALERSGLGRIWRLLRPAAHHRSPLSP
jgi:hypothetical protein